MTAAAWILLGTLILLPALTYAGSLWGRRKLNCACGQFKLPRAAACFDCTTR